MAAHERDRRLEARLERLHAVEFRAESRALRVHHVEIIGRAFDVAFLRKLEHLPGVVHRPLARLGLRGAPAQIGERGFHFLVRRDRRRAVGRQRACRGGRAAARRSATLRPPSKIGMWIAPQHRQRAALRVEKLVAVRALEPGVALDVKRRQKLRARPRRCARRRRPAGVRPRARSGRRESSCIGTPGGTAGGGAVFQRTHGHAERARGLAAERGEVVLQLARAGARTSSTSACVLSSSTRARARSSGPATPALTRSWLSRTASRRSPELRRSTAASESSARRAKYPVATSALRLKRTARRSASAACALGLGAGVGVADAAEHVEFVGDASAATRKSLYVARKPPAGERRDADRRCRPRRRTAPNAPGVADELRAQPMGPVLVVRWRAALRLDSTRRVETPRRRCACPAGPRRCGRPPGEVLVGRRRPDVPGRRAWRRGRCATTRRRIGVPA